jgi:hypothetical protein
MAEHGVRFPAGAVVSPGEYRNTRSGRVVYFDGSTPLPGGPNSGSWQQISDHQHTEMESPDSLSSGTAGASPVRFAAGTVVPAGEYRSTSSGVVRYFDGTTPLPGGPNASAWQQVSDHFHSEMKNRAAST